MHAENGIVKKEGVLWIILPALLLSIVGATVATILPSDFLQKAFGAFLIGLSFVGFFKTLQGE